MNTRWMLYVPRRWDHDELALDGMLSPAKGTLCISLQCRYSEWGKLNSFWMCAAHKRFELSPLDDLYPWAWSLRGTCADGVATFATGAVIRRGDAPRR